MTRITRSDLYDLIWSEPAKDVAARLSMSPEQLRAACETANIPRPDRGYWTHVSGGGKPKRVQLPERQLGQADHIVLIEESRMVSGALRRMFLEGPPLVMPVFPDDRPVIESRAHALAAAAPIRKTLSRTHREISKLLARDERRKPKLTGTSLDVHFHPIISSTKQGKRRLLILNTLLHALASCGGNSAKTTDHAFNWRICIWDTGLHFELRNVGAPEDETARRMAEYERSGDLELVICHKPGHGLTREWRDLPSKPLEEQMREIVAGFLIIAELLYRHREVYRIERLQEEKAELDATIQRHKQERLQEEVARWEKAEEARRTHLLQEVAEWKKAQEIRTFIDARLRADKDGTQEEKDLSERWATWASAVADAIDPITKHRAEENDQ
ncbi:hypothetical protein I5R65_07800 [Herbaspirillum sp. AP02]|uniref:hypothetical protein n=1 Tax=unclassified Herbaspirillum TaxID=2624150 RepID=UPI0015DAB9EB|nr:MULTISPECIES: hypothetical protein [unclassified Herbaspirillum]MBG7619364.1 hypothetical protein [Herbaspirillum sp. AP02]NZD66648.1 hypothetical protein [Herbaspirillum sp. AP21]